LEINVIPPQKKKKKNVKLLNRKIRIEVIIKNKP